jgi:hypothetical protein
MFLALSGQLSAASFRRVRYPQVIAFTGTYVSWELE